MLEALRLLAVGGRLLLSIFITNGYFEITNLPFRRKSDSSSRKVFDPTASLPVEGVFRALLVPTVKMR